MSYNSVRAGHLTSLSSASLAPAIVAMIYWRSVGRARGPDRVAGSLSVSRGESREATPASARSGWSREGNIYGRKHFCTHWVTRVMRGGRGEFNVYF